MGKTLNQWGRCQKDIESVMWWKVFEDESLVDDGLFGCLIVETWNMKERSFFVVVWCGVVWGWLKSVELKVELELKVGSLEVGTSISKIKVKEKRTWINWSWTLGLVIWLWTQSWVTCLGTWTSSGALGSKLGHLKVGTWTSSGAVGLKVGSHEVGTSTSSGEVGTSTSEKGGQTLTKSQKTLTKTSKP